MKSFITPLGMLALLCALFAPASPLHAQGVYVKQGPNGPVFSDKPLPGSKEVTLKPLNVMPAAETRVPVEVKPQNVAPVDGVSPQAADSPFYERFQIVFPENNGSVVANTAVFEVRLAVNPPLRLADQHVFVVSLNGRAVNQRYTATEFMIPADFWAELPPPNQAVQLDASIVDGKGQIVKRAAPVQFVMRYATVYQNPDFPDRPVVLPLPRPHRPVPKPPEEAGDRKPSKHGEPLLRRADEPKETATAGARKLGD